MGDQRIKKLRRSAWIVGLLGLAALVLFLCTIRQKLLPARPATDSGASATALSTGHKTDNGNIAWATGDQPGGALQTMCEHIEKISNGGCGLVSTVPFTHATPAPFAAHNTHRGNYHDMADEIIFHTRPDVVIGGGHPYWSGGSRADPKYKHITEKAFESLLSEDGPYVMAGREEGKNAALTLQAAVDRAREHNKKLFGLFGGERGYLNRYLARSAKDSPRFDENDENPTLFEATKAALDHLATNSNGFFLMIEGGDIDWAGHDNDYKGLIEGMHNFEQAIRKTIELIDSSSSLHWNNTLLIVTSDHANSYMKLNRTNPPTKGVLPEQEDRPGGFCANFDCGSFLYPDGEIEYAHGDHTNELVTLVANGQGAVFFDDLDNKYGDNIVDNTDIHHVMVQALKEGKAKHVLLFIGDGMQEAQEVAYSRYMYGVDTGLIWDDSSLFDFTGLAATWDINTYNRYAAELDRPAYDSNSFDWSIGYDPTRGGIVPTVYTDERTEKQDEYFLTKRFPF